MNSELQRERSYLLDDLWGHSHLFADLHWLSTTTLKMEGIIQPH